MQSKLLSDKELVKICLEELCQKSGFDSAQLVQRDFEFLCDAIESKAGVLISLSTMKRLFHEQFSRLPQVATLDAISAYIGYMNWQDFKVAKKQPLFKEEVPESFIENHTVEINTSHRIKRFYLIPAGLLVITAVGLIAWLKFKKPAPPNFDKAQFSVVKTTNNDIPNTVIFNYNLDDVNADSFFIQQSWDKNRREKIDKNQHTLTDIYYEPGYHVAKLIANDQVIKTIDVSIPTDKWVYYAKEKTTGSLPEYISPATYKNGNLQLTKEDITNNLIDIEKKNEYVMVYFPSKFENSSDNFVLKCRAKVNAIKNDVCPSLMCEVFCQRYFMYFKTKSKGCSNEISAQFADTILNGKNTDLSALAMDVKEWQDIELSIINKKVSIKINSKETFTTQYTSSAGLITGLGFISNGLTEVDFVSLKTPAGKDIYSNDFEKE